MRRVSRQGGVASIAAACAHPGDADRAPQRRRRVLRLAAVSLIAAAAVDILGATPANAVTPIDLGTLGGNESNAVAINRGGEVVGRAQTSAGTWHAFLWTRKRGMVDLGTLGGSESEASSINERGQVAGRAQTSSGATHAFLWTGDRGMVDLGTLGGEWSTAFRVNVRGEVGGNAATSAGGGHAFFWTRKGGMVDLGTLGGSNSWAYAMNDHGQIVGEAKTSSGTTHAFSWTRTEGMVDLGTLGGTSSQAEAINDPGEVAGDGDTNPTCSGCGTHAFLWTARGGLVDIGALEPPEPSYPPQAYPSAMNDRGQIVGSETGHACLTTFSWTQAEGWVALPEPPGFGEPPGLGYRCDSFASAVNDFGQVVGHADRHAVSWIPAGAPIDLGPGSAVAINARGEVIGVLDIHIGFEDIHRAALWDTGRPRHGH